MKIVAKFYLLALLLAVSMPLAAQEVFSVLATKGDVQLQRKGEGAWIKVFTGAKLNKNDNIKLGEGAYLGLVHLKSGKAKEIRNPGTIALSELDKQMSATSSVGSKVVAYVTQDITGSSTKFQDYRKSMANLGSIERATKGTVTPDLPRKTSLMDSIVTFNWITDKRAKEAAQQSGYVFEISNRMGTPIYTKETKDTFVVINLERLNLKHGEHYYWRVNLKENMNANEEDAQPFTLLDNSTRRSIQHDLKAFNEEEPSPLNKIMLARYFESKDLIMDAMKAYQEAIKMAPDVVEYRELYAMFLDRHEMNFLANKVRQEAVASLNR